MQQQVRDAPVVPGAFELKSPMQEGDIGTSLGLSERLRRDERVAQCPVLNDGRCAADRGSNGPHHIPVPIARPIARTTPTSPELYFVEQLAEVREPVRGRGAGEDVVVVAVAVGTRAVGADSARKGQTFVESQDLFVHEERGVAEVSEYVIGVVEDGATVGGLDASQESAGTGTHHSVVLCLPGVPDGCRER